MKPLRAALQGIIAPSVYRYKGHAAPQSICREASKHNFQCFYLDGNEIHDKETFLRACAAALSFPAYFGRNWDALDECLTDLSWLPARGYLMLYDDVAHFARGNPEQWNVALDILCAATDYWQSTSTPMYILLRGIGAAAANIPTLE